ncbi:MAG: ABC transporter permease [Alphaproteobacteria bacterium]|nr:ABC transporter permease [Alphaproteobacteria bacterium]NCQ66192.1 ABC transporter permease [Alphaproteobacteria bacterium]NCT06540.1 ABC transporter permease [Alphaproteobacteria bacterium]
MSTIPEIILDETKPDSVSLFFNGNFEVMHWAHLKSQIEILTLNRKKVLFDFKGLLSLDTFGAWLLAHLWRNLEDKKKEISFTNCSTDDLTFLKELKNFEVPEALLLSLEQKQGSPLEILGKGTLTAIGKFHRIISFLGEVILAIGSCIRHPSSFRVKSFIKYLDQTGVRAIPIIGLVALLIGIVLVYQGVSQLERFGAEIFTVNLLAISVLRELGILLTAIVVAGRSGSAFTAQIGFMKLNQELDAMKVLGLEPMQLLVVPRILALMIVMPLLTVFCDLVALAGGALMSMKLIDLSFSQFISQLQSSFKPSTFWVGIFKAPVFAFTIALIACYEGLQVSGGAESVGRRTTRSVVRSIFMVIVLNAFFSVVFSILKI